MKGCGPSNSSIWYVCLFLVVVSLLSLYFYYINLFTKFKCVIPDLKKIHSDWFLYYFCEFSYLNSVSEVSVLWKLLLRVWMCGFLLCFDLCSWIILLQNTLQCQPSCERNVSPVRCRRWIRRKKSLNKLNHISKVINCSYGLHDYLNVYWNKII